MEAPLWWRWLTGQLRPPAPPRPPAPQSRLDPELEEQRQRLREERERMRRLVAEAAIRRARADHVHRRRRQPWH